MQIPPREWKEHIILNGNILYYKHFDSKCNFEMVILVCCNSAHNSARINSCLHLLFDNTEHVPEGPMLKANVVAKKPIKVCC